MLTAQAVNDVFMDCLFKDEELAGGTPTDFAAAEGITAKFGFHPGRLASHEAELDDWISCLDETFLQSKGGGWSFLNLCNDKNGNQWTGLHRTMEQLCCLCVAAKKAQWCMPKEFWNVMPGGMPYIMFLK